MAERLPTKEEMRAWKERWDLVNAFQIEEARQLSPEERFRDLASLMAMARELDWTPITPEDEVMARERWLQLYKAHGVL